jgi:hypothetical protein
MANVLNYSLEAAARTSTVGLADIGGALTAHPAATPSPASSATAQTSLDGTGIGQARPTASSESPWGSSRSSRARNRVAKYVRNRHRLNNV